MRRHVAALVLAGACLPLAAACGGDDEPSEAQGTTTTSAAETTAPPTTLTKEQEVEAAYREFDAVLAELGPAPNPDDPRLPDLVLEPNLSQIRDQLRQRQASNQIYEISDQSSVDILDTAVDPTGLTATVIVCIVDADRLVDADTGDVLASGVETAKDEAHFRLENDRWMLDGYEPIATWEGATTCAG